VSGALTLSNATHLDEFLLAFAEERADRPAVVELDEAGEVAVLSYRQLVERVQRYTATLRLLGLDIGERVVLESDTCASALAMLLACSRLGLTFIPVCPEMPDARLHAIIASTDAVLHLQVGDGLRTGLPAHVGTGRFGPTGVVLERTPPVKPLHRSQRAASDPAYIVFTSGSTGVPKGVVMSHRGILAFYRSLLGRQFVGAEDRVATTSPFQFDFTLLDIGLALGSGAAVVPVPRGHLRWPRRFVGFLAAAGVTHVNGVPSIWRTVLRYEPEQLAALTKVRGMLYSGERFPPPELRQLQDALPQARIVNCFGSTESVACTFTEVPRDLRPDDERLSIGSPEPGSEILLMDEAGRPVSHPGVVGEMHLRSPALFTGYWNDPVATRAALVPDPLNPRSGQLVYRSGDYAYRGRDGELYFVGRVDSLVKIRGNRVELGEVERKLLEFPGLAAAAAVVVPRPDDDPTLRAFVVPEDPVGVFDEMALTAFCIRELPDYMVPQELRVLAELPVNENGKVDRLALVDAGSGG